MSIMSARRDADGAGPSGRGGGRGGGASLAERRAAKQRERREKKRAEKASRVETAVVSAVDGEMASRSRAAKRARVSEGTEGCGAPDEDDESRSGDGDGDEGAGPDSDAAPASETIEAVERKGSYGNYGKTDGRMSIEDDEWATAPRTWAALSPYLSKFYDKKVWMPFYYDGEAGKRLKATGFRRVVHKREDFFKRVNDRVFVDSVDVVVDNPPYTGKGMKERVLKALVEADVPFCLLLPLGVLHGAMVRETLDQRHVQCLIPRRCWVSKRGGAEVPFKYLVWLCYKLDLDRDLVLMPDT